MKKRLVSMVLVCSMLTLSACGKKEEVVVQEPTTVAAQDVFEPVVSSTEDDTEVVSEVPASQMETEETQSEEETTTVENKDSATLDLLALTEGEIAARKEQQANLQQARDSLYAAPNGKDKTEKIVQLDKQILENNTYHFFEKKFCFIGDSITEGVKASVGGDGLRISYPEYAADALHIGTMLNHGKGGRMFTTYGGEEYSIVTNFDNIVNADSDVFVVFAGVNDYLTIVDNKRFGDINNKDSNAGYCGEVRYFMKTIKNNFPGKDVFFVLMFPIDKVVTANYSDITTQPTLDDYLEVQRKLCAEYGFHVIDLYKQGFMDCTSQESMDYYLNDGLHPKDNGNIALGTHIAAELSLYYSQK